MSSPYDETHDWGNFYWHTMRLPRSVPVLQRTGVTHEVTDPWRVGRCWVLRLWKVGLAVGWWGAPRSHEELLRAELGPLEDDVEMAHAAGVDVESIREDFREQEPRTSHESPYDVRTWA